MEKEPNLLNGIAIQWQKEEESFFLDVEFSERYLNLDTPIGKKHAWQVDKHDILESVNLKSLFDTYYRTKHHDEFVPWFPMLSEMMTESTFAPAQLDLGLVHLYSEAKFTDVISGISGNMGNSGWIVSKKFFEIVKNYNIGRYQTYKIVVKSKNIMSEDYVYLHFINYADEYVNFAKSIFYTKTGLMNFESRKVMPHSFDSSEEIEKTSDALNFDIKDYYSRTAIRAKEIFLNANSLDIFKFKNPFLTDERFISIKLAEILIDEKITGLDFIRTTKVK